MPVFSKILFCSYLAITKWLQNNLIPCPFKKLTGIDCPGCGFQRAVLALLEGDLKESLHFYPAAIPLFAAAVFSIADARYHFNKGNNVKKVIYILTGFIIVGSYISKLAY